jgi:glutamate-1-semialdehyde 2,1-aminomutase
MLAVKLARASTGRDLVIKAQTGYHGSYDVLETDEAGRIHPMALAGVYDDLPSFEDLLQRHAQRVAAIFVEPVQGGGTFSASPAFLTGLRSAADAAGCLLVFDEVISFRLAEGGVQSVVGVRPDLTMFGKIIGGGFPVGAVGGRADVMDRFSPSRDDVLFHSGTFNGNPVTCAAGIVSVEALTTDRIDVMSRQAERIEQRLTKSAADLDLRFSVSRAGSLLTTFFESPVPLPPRERNDAEAMRLFHLACLGRGLFLATRGLVALSTVATDEVVDDAIERMEGALGDVAAALN